MLERRPEPGCDQQRAELVAVKRDGMGFIVQPRPADVRGRGMLQEFLLDGVAVGPGDRAQPPGNGGAGAPFGFQVAGGALDVGAADGEQVQGAAAAPAGELAQVQRVGLPVRGSERPARAAPGLGSPASVSDGERKDPSVSLRFPATAGRCVLPRRG